MTKENALSATAEQLNDDLTESFDFDELEERHFIVLSSGEVVYSENGKDIRATKKLI